MDRGTAYELISQLTSCLVCAVVALPFLFLALFIVARTYVRCRAATGRTVAFFHPYCNAGGGGERVLWCAIKAIQSRYEDIECVVYSGDTDTTGEAIVVRARERFGVSVPRPVRFVWLRRRAWLEAERYPHLTLLGQSFGSLVVAWEALCLLAPDLYVDTTGYAFTLPLFRYVGGCRVACYVHYPTVSTDMLTRVRQRTRAHNNSARIADSAALSALKAHYYGAFAGLYGLAGRCSHGVMVNSTWTRGHIETLWGTDRGCLRTVYPPCGTAEFLELPCDRPAKGLVVSIGQFRPEKDHELQIKSFGKFLDSASRTSGASRAPSDGEHYKLVFIGSCRNSEDSGRVDKLQQLCRQLGIADSVEFRVNAPFHEVKRCLGEATIGLHAMWNEHFGIGIVECMAAGTVVLAHDSGGPKLDIVDTAEHQRTGFLASDVDTYAEAMQSIFSMSSEERLAIVQRARSSVLRFSEEKFEQEFLSAIAGLLVTIL